MKIDNIHNQPMNQSSVFYLVSFGSSNERKRLELCSMEKI